MTRIATLFVEIGSYDVAIDVLVKLDRSEMNLRDAILYLEAMREGQSVLN